MPSASAISTTSNQVPAPRHEAEHLVRLATNRPGEQRRPTADQTADRNHAPTLWTRTRRAQASVWIDPAGRAHRSLSPFPRWLSPRRAVSPATEVREADLATRLSRGPGPPRTPLEEGSRKPVGKCAGRARRRQLDKRVPAPWWETDLSRLQAPASRSSPRSTLRLALPRARVEQLRARAIREGRNGRGSDRGDPRRQRQLASRRHAQDRHAGARALHLRDQTVLTGRPAHGTRAGRRGGGPNPLTPCREPAA